MTIHGHRKGIAIKLAKEGFDLAESRNKGGQ
jgi:hypothetical protein